MPSLSLQTCQASSPCPCGSPPLPSLSCLQVSANDDMDDSDAEHTFLREKRMRRPARLWRSARERAVWLRMVRRAQSAEQAAYCAFILCDRWVGGWVGGWVLGRCAPALVCASW